MSNVFQRWFPCYKYNDIFKTPLDLREKCGYCGNNITKKVPVCLYSWGNGYGDWNREGHFILLMYWYTYTCLYIYMYNFAYVHILRVVTWCWYWLVLRLYEWYLTKTGIIVHAYSILFFLMLYIMYIYTIEQKCINIAFTLNIHWSRYCLVIDILYII